MRRAMEVETRNFEDGSFPFSKPSGDIGGFREVLHPSAFTKTLQERPALSGTVSADRQAVRFGPCPVSVEFAVIRDRWLISRSTGDIRRELLELRLVKVSSELDTVRVSGRARAIAAGVRRDYASGFIAAIQAGRGVE